MSDSRLEARYWKGERLRTVEGKGSARFVEIVASTSESGAGLGGIFFRFASVASEGGEQVNRGSAHFVS
jgi:hypothetical protein